MMRHMSYHCAPTELASRHWLCDDDASALPLCYYCRPLNAIKTFLPFYPSPSPSSTAGFKPFTLGWWDICPTTVLPLNWSQTLDLGMMMQVFHCCAVDKTFQYFLPPIAIFDDWIQTLYLGIMIHMSYPCATTKLDSNHWPWDDDASYLLLCYYCRPIKPIKPLPAAMVGLKPFTIGLWDIYPTTVIPQNWTRTIDLGMMRQVFYCCATTTG